MQRSETISEFAAAFAKAQGEIENAVKGKENPHFRSKYADLGAIWDACRSPLTKNGISVIQFPRADHGTVEVETILLHTSGEWMSDTLSLIAAKQDAQGIGSAITYARRYALASAVGVAPEDDDGNAAVQGGGGNVKPSQAKPAEPALPPLDPAKPEAIAFNGKTQANARQWAARFGPVIKLAPNKEALSDWFDLNEGALEKVKELDEASYKRICEIHDTLDFPETEPANEAEKEPEAA